MIPLRDANPTRRTPYVTLGLIAACVLVFVYELTLEASLGDRGISEAFLRFGVVPARLATALGRGDFLGPATVSVATSLFLHAGFLHLAGNMLYLWIFGNNIEDRLGRLPFLVFYLAGGFAAALTQTAIDPGSRVPMVGASGAIAATLGAYLVLYPGARILSLVFLGFFYQLIEVPALIVLGLWFVLQVVDGVASLGVAGANAGGIAIFAHIGGFVAGMAVALPFRGRRPPGRWSVG